MIKNKNIDFDRYKNNEYMSNKTISDIVLNNVECSICNKNNKIKNLMLNYNNKQNKKNKYFYYLLNISFIKNSKWFLMNVFNNDEIDVFKKDYNLDDEFISYYGFYLKIVKQKKIKFIINQEFVEYLNEKLNKTFSVNQISINMDNKCESIFLVIYELVNKFFTKFFIKLKKNKLHYYGIFFVKWDKLIILINEIIKDDNLTQNIMLKKLQYIEI
tara:strand:+ start:162 stop:806 length:645 start_codon:yes stop_codon:yes gene_type:complete